VHEPRIACIRMTNGSTANVVFNNLLVARSLAYAVADEVGGNYTDPVSNLKLTSVSGWFEGVGAGDYHLLPTSPGVDAGVFAYRSVTAPTTDQEGTPRPQGPQSDVGALEHASATAVGDAPRARVALEQNAPNPFGASTRIVVRAAAGAEARVALDVFDARGRRVRSLLQNRFVSGSLDVVWDGRDDHGRSVPSGVYFCRLTTPEGVMTRRMTLVR
jgi:hypothetical protein